MNLKDSFLGLNNYFSPRIIGEVNDQYIKVVKVKGDQVPWHNHRKEDEMFYIIKGSLLMEIENQDAFIMRQGDIYVVKKATNHRVSSKRECLIISDSDKPAKDQQKIYKQESSRNESD